MVVYSLVLFGSPILERDGQPIALDTRKALALLAYLALTGERHSRDHLATLFWAEYPQAQARASLRRTLSVLHQELPETELDIHRESLGLRPGAALQVDVREFRRLIAGCQSHGHDATEACSDCLKSLSAAIALYHGDFLAGFGLRDSPAFDDWQYLQQDSLRREMMSALERLTAGYCARQQFDLAIKQTLRWVELDRLHEAAHRQLMLLYNWTGDRSAALHQYRTCVRALDEALGVAPLEATTQLYEAIRENRAPAPPLPAQGSSHGTHGNVNSSAGVSRKAEDFRSGSVSPAKERPVYPLIERESERATLVETYQRIALSHPRNGHLIVLRGEAGIGKTRLAEEFVSYAERHEKAAVISSRCYEGESNLAYRPLVSALRGALADPEACWMDSLPPHILGESARLVPELADRRKGLAPPSPLETPGAQTRFFEGVAETLRAACGGAGEPSASPPGILFLDDIQWADRSSLDVLTYMVRRLDEFPVCLLLTWRKIEVPSSSRIQRLIAEASRSGRACVITLARLSLVGVRRLAQSLPDTDATTTAERAERLYQETEGLPLFLVEYLASLAGAHEPGEPAEWPVPGSIRELLRLRLQAIGESSLQVLTAGAVIGRSFDFDTVWSASGRSEEETVAALEELVAQGLVAETSQIGHPTIGDLVYMYDFTHDQLRRLVYDEISLARRRLLHRRIAEALVRRASGRSEPRSLSGVIARHYLEAGDPSEAARQFKIAGERARSLYANTEALEHFSSALALGHPDAAGLHEAIGDLYTVLGAYTDALKSYQASAALCNAEELALLEHKIGRVYARRGNYHAATTHFESALAGLSDMPPAANTDGETTRVASARQAQQARIYADWSLAERNQRQLERAHDLAERALTLAESAQDIQARAQAHNMLGILATGQGRLDQAVLQLEESLRLSQDLPAPTARVAALNNLALALGSAGEIAKAVDLAETALSLCVSEGDRHREAALHNNLADLLHSAGRSEEAVVHVKASVAIYAEIGVEAGTVQPEIWKLAEW